MTNADRNSITTPIMEHGTLVVSRDAQRLALFGELVGAAIAFEQLATCYRIGQRPPETLLDQLTKSRDVLARARELK